MFLLLDAFALRAAADHADAIVARGNHTVLTPHEGELAAMLGTDKHEVSRDPLDALTEAADRFGAAVMVKGATSHLMADGTCLSYAGGGLGLAVSGSGDVLAGLIAGLGAQGLPPLQAAAWGIWLHGEAGRRLSETMGPIGYLARELAPLAPGLMRGV
jgi:NAD(P)H-hydrate repair Nnr-like enzyme with NAD(P)H-hydrate dehydratase domain